MGSASSLHPLSVQCPATADATSHIAAPQEFDLEAVYREHFAFVWRSLRRLGVEEPLLPDATQDVFMVVHRRLPSFERRSSLSTWLFGIALRVARDYRGRKAQSRAPTEPFEPFGVLSDETERVEAQRLVRRALDQLDEARRAVFILTDLEGMSATEIAEALGIPLGTVYTRIRLARRDFEAALRSFGLNIPERRP